jgi:hypothetical protein
VAAGNYQQILNPNKPALAQDEFDCVSFDSQAEAQAELRRDPSGLDGPIGTASEGTSGVACEVYPYDDPARDETPVEVGGGSVSASSSASVSISPDKTILPHPLPAAHLPKQHYVTATHVAATHLRPVVLLHRLRHSHQGIYSTLVDLQTDQYPLCQMVTVR